MTPVMLGIGGFILITGVGWVGSMEQWTTGYTCLLARVISAGPAKGPRTKSSPRPCLCCGLRWADTLELALGVAGSDKSAGKTRASFAGARTLAVLIGICWSLDIYTTTALSLRGRQEGSAVTPLTAMQIYLSLCHYLAYQFCSLLL